MPWINAPICEACWIAQHAQYIDGALQIRRPVRLTDPDLEVCHRCEALTIFGAYVRVNLPAADTDT